MPRWGNSLQASHPGVVVVILTGVGDVVVVVVLDQSAQVLSRWTTAAAEVPARQAMTVPFILLRVGV